MYEFHYVNLTAPAGWLLLLSLLAVTLCHLIVLYLTLKIDRAVHTAREEVHDAVVSQIAIRERELLEIWRSARRLCIWIIPFFFAAWVVGLGRP